MERTDFHPLRRTERLLHFTSTSHGSCNNLREPPHASLVSF
jgi:hypothetical protein